MVKITVLHFDVNVRVSYTFSLKCLLIQLFLSREPIEITKGALKNLEPNSFLDLVSQNFWGRILEYLEALEQPIVYMYYCILTRHLQDLGNLKHNARTLREDDREGKK